MLDTYIDEQYISTTLLKKAIDNNKLVQAYLFSGDDINYLMKYAKSFAKEIISPKENQKYIIKSIDENNYPELKIVETDGNFIKKEQLIELQNSVMTKPVLGKKIVYIIKSCDKLNASSANCILKFLEEPADDIIAILLTDNINNVMSTIISRCQIINLNKVINNSNISSYELLNSIINVENIDIEEFNSIVDNSINFMNEIENKKINIYIYIKKYLWENYTDTVTIRYLFTVLIYFYMDILYYKTENIVKYFYDMKEDIIKISNLNEINVIINKIYILEKLKLEINYNINTKLLFDKLVIELGDTNGK